jgi:hypothetical protein
MPYRISIIHPSNALYTGYIGDETSLAETTCHTGKPKQGLIVSKHYPYNPYEPCKTQLSTILRSALHGS